MVIKDGKLANVAMNESMGKTKAAELAIAMLTD